MKKDGYWSWLVLVCVCLSQIIIGGICLNGGLFYIVFGHAYSTDAITLSWLCSLPVTIWFITAPVGSFLANRYSYRSSAFIGGLIAALAISVGYLATSIEFLFLSHGILTGLGFGINHTSTMVAVSRYFEKFRVVALGLASTGNNGGLIIYAQLFVLLEHMYGWRGMMLILGGITFHLCAFAAVMIPVKDKISDENCGSVNSVRHVAKKSNRIVDFSIFRKMSFVYFCASNVFFNVGYGIYSLHLPSYSKQAGFQEADVVLMWLSMGSCNVVGKFFFSFLGQHPKVNPTIVYTVALVLGGVTIGLLPHVFFKVGILVNAGLVGFFTCVTGALIHSVIYDIVGYDRFADGTGWSLPFKATGNLIGGPLAGLLLSSTGVYRYSFYLAGVSMFFSSVLMLGSIFHQRRRKSQPKHLLENNISIKFTTDLKDTDTEAKLLPRDCASEVNVVKVH